MFHRAEALDGLHRQDLTPRERAREEEGEEERERERDEETEGG